MSDTNLSRVFLTLAVLVLGVAAGAQPVLTPYQPAGWSDSVVVTTNPNSTTDTTGLTTTNALYVDWAVINSGNADATTAFSVDLYTNSVFMNTWQVNGLPVGNYTYVTAIPLGLFPAGTNTIELVADSTSVYGAPNTYTKTFIVKAPVLPSLSAPTLLGPANGSVNQSTSPTFTWTSVSNAASYQIFVATNAADLPTNTTAIVGGPSMVISASVTNATFTPVNPLNPGTTYYWEVNARLFGEGGPWSGTWSYTSGNPPAGLTILPVFDTTITSDPQAGAIEATIRAAAAFYQYHFSDPLTVSITFQEMSTGLGMSSWSYNSYSYGTYLQALTAAATTPDDTTALAHLPVQANNPVNANGSINLQTALSWDLGLSAGTSGENVGTISLNTSLMNLSGAQNNPTNYSLFSTVCHEIDEVLATGSALDGVYSGQNLATDPIFSEDLFRYDSSGNRSYNTNLTTTAYFSLDGVTDLAQFNQVGSGDFGDWYSYYGGETPQVQDAFAEPLDSPNPTVELRVLDVLGYHLEISVPPPNFVSATRTGNTINLVWEAVSGRAYQVQETANLTSSVWSNLSGSVIANGSTASYSDTVVSGQERFYRVELVSNPLPALVPATRFIRANVVTQPTGWKTNYFRPFPL